MFLSTRMSFFPCFLPYFLTVIFPSTSSPVQFLQSGLQCSWHRCRLLLVVCESDSFNTYWMCLDIYEKKIMVQLPSREPVVRRNTENVREHYFSHISVSPYVHWMPTMLTRSSCTGFSLFLGFSILRLALVLDQLSRSKPIFWHRSSWAGKFSQFADFVSQLVNILVNWFMIAVFSELFSGF